MTQIKQEDIIGLECKHAVYAHPKDAPFDLLVVKEKVYLKDGRCVPRIRRFKDYPRDFYVTKPNFRNHTDKKEWEDVDKLQKYTTPQHKLLASVSKALGRGMIQGGMPIAGMSPYLYGTDVTTPVLLKYGYRKKWPQFISDNLVATLDIETDVVHGTEEIVSITLACKENVILCVKDSFVEHIPEPEKALQTAMETYLGEVKKARNINLQVHFGKTPGELIKKIFERAHEISPDIIAIWNINFDLPKILAALDKERINAADVLSDPSVPPAFRFVKYVEGRAKQQTATGALKPIHPADRWHKMECPASFVFLDAMCVYKKLRVTKGNETSYRLDHILNKNLGVRKLNFDVADHLKGLDWHKFMQSKYPIEYCIYNVFDCVGMEMLDDETNDLKRVISVLVEHSEYTKFPSQPKRTCDDLHFFVQNEGKIMGSTGKDMVDENDKFVLGMNDWIVTLPSYLVDDGLCLIEEMPDHPTAIFTHVADCDAVGTYPTLEVVMNISKETTLRELCMMRDIPEEVQRAQGINLTGGTTNAMEIVRTLYNAPSMDTLLQNFRRDRGLVQNPDVLDNIHRIGERVRQEEHA
ncbi:DNA polymerase [Xanthomonas phage Xoo-sp14]|nr:DNA polymerase [Xanthomonas phage Xoo-sp14]